QYAAPGTEFSGYADGAYVGETPLGPFIYQPHNPFAYKPGGFARGAGHGATFKDKQGQLWHVGTIVISVKNNFERRIGVWRAGIDSDGILRCNTAYGDYPQYLPGQGPGGTEGGFTGWMLLNYNKPVQVSSTLGGYAPNFAVDEDIRTYWSAVSGDKGEWFQTDLGEICTVRAIQVNYADQDAELMGKQEGIYHRYIIECSDDGTDWKVLVERSRNMEDVPHDYIELEPPVRTRYLKIRNIHVPTGKFALSGFRVFGKGNGEVPGRVEDFVVLRGDSERRNAWLKWQTSVDAIGYNISVGIAPGKLYNHIQVYGANQYYFPGMARDQAYYFTIEAFNENGIGERSDPFRVE
ncbi:MAG: xylosidase, partial [Bacteroidetes bacterium]